MALLLVAASSQAATISMGKVGCAAGVSEAKVPITLLPQPGEQVSGLQFEIILDENKFTLTALKTGSSAQEAGKVASYNRIAPGRYRAIVAGLNQNSMTQGALAEADLKVLPGVRNGEHALVLENVVLSDPNGRAVMAIVIPGMITVGEMPPGEPPSTTVDPAPLPRCGCTAESAPGKHFWGDMVIIGCLLLLIGIRKPKGGEEP